MRRWNDSSSEVSPEDSDSCLRMKYWLRLGVQVSASAREVSSAIPIVTARARKKVPVTPVIEISGRNTTIGVTVEPTSGTVISRKALWIACSRP